MALVLANGTVVWPVQRVMKRFMSGPRESVVAYGAALGLTPTRRIPIIRPSRFE